MVQADVTLRCGDFVHMKRDLIRYDKHWTQTARGCREWLMRRSHSVKAWTRHNAA